MQIGIVGLGRMGGNIARRLMRAGHECVGYDASSGVASGLAAEGLAVADSINAFVVKLAKPRRIWIMVPHQAVDATIAELAKKLSEGDIVIDGGNTHYAEDAKRAASLARLGIEYVDVGTSGGIWGLEEGYCLMVGGENSAVVPLVPIFNALAPKDGWLHCGPAGAGHFVKMVHNGIEYGVMAAYAEGFNLLQHAEGYRFDAAKISELWRQGSVIRSWLLDLAAAALAKDPQLAKYKGVVSDSGEGRWTVKAAVDSAVPAPVLSAALFSRFASRGEDDFANRLLSAMREEFGGHRES